jgi:hypothetical protein
MKPDEFACGPRLSPTAFEVVVRRSVSESFKWNLDDGGQSRLCDFPLLVGRELADEFACLAVALDAEAREAELELLERPDLHARLGLAGPLRRALRDASAARDGRFARFDFHPMVGGGFAITEGNLDVAGGFNESSGVARIFAEHVVGGEAVGDPAAAVATAIRAAVGPGARVGCLHLTNFTDDHQVARFVARELERAGTVPVLFGPGQLRWEAGSACALVGADLVPLSAVFRFLPADWLPRLERASEWQRIFQPGSTLWVNPGSTILTQSKRFPLVWSELHAGLATWKSLLPETRSPLRAFGEHWVLKPALAHEGYRVGMPGITDERDYLRIRLESRLVASRWVAQRRFHAAAIATPDGPRFPCVGSYVVNGRPAGLYGRLAVKPVIDDKAQDVVVLVRER